MQELMFLGQPSDIMREGAPASPSSSRSILLQVLHYALDGHQRDSLWVAHSSNQLGNIVLVI